MAQSPDRAGPTALGTSTGTIVTAGGAGTWKIVRAILICNVHTGPVTVTAGIGTSNADAAAKRIISGLTINQAETIEVVLNGYYTLHGHGSTPDLLYALCNVANGATMTLGLWNGP